MTHHDHQAVDMLLCGAQPFIFEFDSQYKAGVGEHTLFTIYVVTCSHVLVSLHADAT